MKKQIARLVDVMLQAFTGLGSAITPEEASGLARTVYEAMTGNNRSYHNLEHVFYFVEPDNPIITLAALYHDVVYYQVDLGIPATIHDLICPYFTLKGNTFTIAENIQPDEILVWMALDVFDLNPGQSLHKPDKFNEFLSALVMVKTIGHLVPRRALLAMLVCIEATIPFRPRNARGQTPFEAMEERLLAISSRYCTSFFSLKDIEQVIKTAVVFANHDIANFAESDPARFLANTWKLLPENNLELQDRQVYTIRAYRSALQKVESFLYHLVPEDIFNFYKDTPPPDVVAALTERARYNIKITSDYLRVRIVSTTLLLAIAESTGGDAPLNLFVGDVPSNASPHPHRIDAYLPPVPLPEWAKAEPNLCRLLEHGREEGTNFDIHNSPLSFFIFKNLPPDKMAQAFIQARGFGIGRVTAAEYMAFFEPALLSSVVTSVAEMFPARREHLLNLIRIISA